MLRLIRAMSPSRCGAIDLGGTKIEACLFDEDAQPLRARRTATPAEAGALLDALEREARWLTDEAGEPHLPLGLGLPGVVDPRSGEGLTANLPGGGDIAGALSRRLGRRVTASNDALAFAVSEARGGAAEGARAVVGLILGTGVGGGYVLDGRPAPRHAGLSAEIGHVGMPAAALARHGLLPWPCGCGRLGCIEAHVAGPALAGLAGLPSGRAVSEALAAGEPAAEAAVTTWADLAGEALRTLHLLLDPEVIVLGGGLSLLPGVAERLSASLERHRLGPARLPAIRLARFGDASGTRGMALLARDAAC